MQVSKRMLIGCIMAVLALPLAGAVSNASAQNLLANGDFETGDFTGWWVFGEIAGATATVQNGDNGPALPGSNNAFMSNNVSGHGMTLKASTPDGSVGGAGLVTYSYDVKVDEALAGGVLFVEVWAEKAGGGIVGGSGLQGPYFNSEWATISGSFNAPFNTDFLTIQIMPNTGANIGSNCIVHIDNVSLESEAAVANEATTWGAAKTLYR